MQVVKITPRSGWQAISWRELFEYRELLFFLVWRDVLVRYKQTALGVAWAVLQPLFLMLIFSVIFGRLAKIDSEGLPYPVYVYAGLLPWTFFANSVTQAGLSLLNQQNLLTKIYFPRLFVPTSSVGAALVDLLLAYCVYAAVLFYYQVTPAMTMFYSPLLITLLVIAALGFGYTLSALTVMYRDFRFVIPFMIQAMMYLSPVVYPVSMVPEKFQTLLALNPMTGIIHAFVPPSWAPLSSRGCYTYPRQSQWPYSSSAYFISGKLSAASPTSPETEFIDMKHAAISIRQLGKSYRLNQYNKPDNFRDLLVSMAKAPLRLTRGGISAQKHDFWALRDVSFSILPGEVVGIVGRNGAGKSTLLKILSRITEPSAGEVILRGRVSSLLEVGTGFHPELTGRENIFLNGSILGMKHAEIRARFDEIVAFAEVEKFLDTPVKRYSSGMYVRLAFAVAAHLEPEILIVDEVLAVGDMEFQKKCLGKMGEVARDGRTVLIVSHNMSVIQSLCKRSILLRQGRLVDDGETERVIKAYLHFLSQNDSDPFVDNPERTGNGAVRLTAARLLDANGYPAMQAISGADLQVEFRYENPKKLAQTHAKITLYNHLGIAVANLSTRFLGKPLFLSSRGVLTCRIPKLPLPLGEYRIEAALVDNHNGVYDQLPNALVFDVSMSIYYQTGLTPDIQWSTALFDYAWRAAT